MIKAKVTASWKAGGQQGSQVLGALCEVQDSPHPAGWQDICPIWEVKSCSQKQRPESVAPGACSGLSGARRLQSPSWKVASLWGATLLGDQSSPGCKPQLFCLPVVGRAQALNLPELLFLFPHLKDGAEKSSQSFLV